MYRIAPIFLLVLAFLIGLPLTQGQRPRISKPTFSMTGAVASWTYDINAVGYQLRYRATNGGDWKHITTPTNIDRYDFSGLPTGVRYRVQIRALSLNAQAVRHSEWSDSQFFRLGAAPPAPPPPTETPRPLPTATFTPFQPHQLGAPTLQKTGETSVQWSKVEGAILYQISWTNEAGAWAHNSKVVSPETRYTVGGLRPGVTYRIRVHASGDGANYTYAGPWSNEVELRIAPPVPRLHFPDGLRHLGGAMVRWDGVSHAVGYRVYVKASGVNIVKDVSGTQFEIPGLQLGSTYQIFVLARGDGVNYVDSGTSNPIEITVHPTATPIPPTATATSPPPQEADPPARSRSDDDDDDRRDSGECKKSGSSYSESRQADGCTQTRTCTRWKRVSGQCRNNDGVDCGGWSSCPKPKPCRRENEQSSRRTSRSTVQIDGATYCHSTTYIRVTYDWVCPDKGTRDRRSSDSEAERSLELGACGG